MNMNSLIEALEEAEDNRDCEHALAHYDDALPIEIFDKLLNGENPIKTFREYKGFTQKELSEKAKIATPYLSQLEHNKRAPSVDTLKALAETLTVDMELLLPQRKKTH